MDRQVDFIFVKKLNKYKVVQKVLLSGTGFCYYKVGQLLLQSGTSYLITRWDNFITKWDGYYKVRQFYYKVRRVLQNGPVITK